MLPFGETVKNNTVSRKGVFLMPKKKSLGKRMWRARQLYLLLFLPLVWLIVFK